VRRNLRVTGSVLAGFLLLWAAVSAAVSSFVEMTGGALVGAAGDRMSLLVLFLGVVVAFNFFVAALLSFAVAAFSCLLIVRLYLDLQGEEAVPDRFFEERTHSSEASARTVLSGKVIIGTAGAALAVAVVASLGLLENLSLEDRVTITAHRGSSLTAPENTLSAVEHAIAEGADVVEFDVQESADGVVVVAHDADLMRVAGEPVVVTGSTFEELRRVDVGGRFDPKFAGERIPTLEEVIESARGRVGLIVEIKTYAGDYRSLVDKVVRTIGEKHVKDSAVVMSLEFREVEEVRRLDPGVTVGFTPAVALGDLTRLDCDFLAVSASMARDSLIGAAHAAGKEVYVWTVNEPADISLMIDRGVDSIITDDPAAAARVLAERAELSNAERLLLRFKALYVD
jgi:glycerophosphoryl diester phosphodiesterase